MDRTLRIAILVSLMTAALAACGGGGSDTASNSTPPTSVAPPASPPASDPTPSPAQTPPVASAPSAPAPAPPAPSAPAPAAPEPAEPAPPTAPVEVPNSAPTISGNPATSLLAGAQYSFTPAASDPDGDALTFSISGKPAWATFSVATGKLSGTAQAGSYPNIVITVTDGAIARSLPAFSITVNTPVTTASLTWVAPSQYTDGTALPLEQLAGYRVYHGSSATTLKPYHDIDGAQLTSYVARDLAPGQHCFAIAAVAVSNVESAMSAPGCKTI